MKKLTWKDYWPIYLGLLFFFGCVVASIFLFGCAAPHEGECDTPDMAVQPDLRKEAPKPDFFAVLLGGSPPDVGKADLSMWSDLSTTADMAEPDITEPPDLKPPPMFCCEHHCHYIEAHCFNGMKDGDELAVDCGGSCQGCPRGTLCGAPRWGYDCFRCGCAELLGDGIFRCE